MPDSVSTLTKEIAPDAGQGIEGANQTTTASPERIHLMSKTVAPTTDSREPIDLDAGLTEFEEYMRDCYPKVSPKSPYFRLIERDYFANSYVRTKDVHERLFPDVPVPAWHEAEEMETPERPADYNFVSSRSQVILRKYKGLADDMAVRCATLNLHLRQNVNQREPIIVSELSTMVFDDTDTKVYGPADKTLLRYTLDEAVEVANLLLLLVEVARDAGTEA